MFCFPPSFQFLCMCNRALGKHATANRAASPRYPSRTIERKLEIEVVSPDDNVGSSNLSIPPLPGFVNQIPSRDEAQDKPRAACRNGTCGRDCPTPDSMPSSPPARKKAVPARLGFRSGRPAIASPSNPPYRCIRNRRCWLSHQMATILQQITNIGVSRLCKISIPVGRASTIGLGKGSGNTRWRRAFSVREACLHRGLET
jgi:hypothetical protein